MDDRLASALSDIRNLQAEVGRLRAALQQIADMPDEDNEWDGRDNYHKARTFARVTIAVQQPAEIK